MPRAWRSIRRAGRARHPQQGGDGGGSSGPGLRDPGHGRSEKNRPRVGWGGAARRHGAACGGRTQTADSQPVAIGRGGVRLGLHAIGPAYREDRPHAAASHAGAVATRPHLPGRGRPGRHWMRRGRLAGGPRRRRHCAERASRTRCRGSSRHRHAARTRRHGRGGIGRRDRRRGGRRDAGAHRCSAPAARRRHPQRGGASRRRAHQPDMGEL